MVVEESTLLSFIEQGLEVAKAIPEYFSKYSNKIYTNHQHIVLVVLKQKLRTTWRDLIEIIKITIIPQKIGLKKIPNFTTLIKFSKKLSPSLINNLLSYSTSLSKPKILKLGVDATGLELDNASKHYAKILDKDTTRKDVIQVTACGLMDTLLISSAKIERYNVVRNNNFLQVVEESSQLGKVEFVAADKGYDAHNNHKFVMFDIKAKSLIKLKNVSTKIRNWRKNYRKIAAKQFDEKLYHQRSKIETIFSMVKRKYNPKIRGKTRETQIQEGYHKLLTHNLDRLCKIISTLLEGFIRASLPQVYYTSPS